MVSPWLPMCNWKRPSRSVPWMAVLLSMITGGCISGEDLETPPPRRIAYHRPSPSPRPYSPARSTTHLPRRRKPPPAPYPRSWLPANGRVSPRWTSVIIHHSATKRGSAREFDRFHREKNGWDELGYHFVIGNGTSTPDGLVEVGPRWHKQKHGAHCKTPGNYYNEHGIGICLVGDFSKSRPTRKQLTALNKLLRFLASRCGIGRGQITTHGAVTGKTRCPGRFFPIAAVRRALATPLAAASVP